MPTATPSLLTRIQLVAIPSTDQDRSVAFYEMLGFVKRNPWGDGHRWVEVYPPNAPTGLALVPPGPSDPTSVQTGIIFNTMTSTPLTPSCVHSVSTSTNPSHAWAHQPRFVLVPSRWPALCRRCSTSAIPTATGCSSCSRADENRKACPPTAGSATQSPAVKRPVSRRGSFPEISAAGRAGEAPFSIGISRPAIG